MLSLGPAFFIVLLELTVGSFVSLAFLDVRGDTSRGFVVFQGVLYVIFALLTLLAMNAFGSASMMAHRGLDERWLGYQGPLALTFLLLLLPWNVLLWIDRPAPDQRKKKQVGRTVTTSRTRARFAVGALATVAGVAALFADGMAYRTLADSHLGGGLVVAAFLAGGLALGGVMTAMLLGHWYLNTPTASGKPLEFATTLMLAALAAELIFSVFIGPSTARPTLQTQALVPGTTIETTAGGAVKVSTPTVVVGANQKAQPSQQSKASSQTADSQQIVQARQAPITTGAMSWLQVIMGLLAPLILGGIALYLTRGRSFQSATGMLYLCVAFIFIGEILGRGLLVQPVFG